MQAFANDGCKGKDLHLLNICQMHYETIVPSDICSGDGKCISPECLSIDFQSELNSLFDWPWMGELNNTIWNLWQQAIRKCFVQHHKCQHLQLPLNKWFGNIAAPDQCCPVTEIAHGRTGAQWLPMKKLESKCQARFKQQGDCVSSHPEMTLPTIFMTFPAGLHQQIPCCVKPPMEWWGDCCEQGNLQTSLQAMQKDHAHCIADGSFEESFGTAAFQLIAHSCNPKLFAHANQMPWTAKDVDPF